MYAVISVVLVIVASSAFAGVTGTIDIDDVTFGLSDSARITGGGLTDYNTRAGIFTFVTSNPTGSGVDIVDYGFCIDLHQGIQGGETYDVMGLQENTTFPMGDTKADYIRELWGRYFDTAWLAGGTENQQMGEAFGIAVWEIINETDSWDVTSGAGFSATNVEKAGLANQWLGSLNKDTSQFNNNLVSLGNASSQDFVSVPEPATISLLIIGGLSLFSKRLRRRV